MIRVQRGFRVAVIFGALVLALPLIPAVAASGGVQAEAICAPTPTGPPGSSLSGGFHAINPTRVLDTRVSIGQVGAGCTVPVDLSGIVASPATAVALDVVAVEATGPGFVTVYPCNAARPLASNLNANDGNPTPNAVVVALDPSRDVCFYASVAMQVVVDVTGWFGPGGASYTGITPDRVLDTRFGPRPDGGAGQLSAGDTIAIPLRSQGEIPDGAVAVAVNLTVTNTADAGFITAFPCGLGMPVASNGNYVADDTRATQALVGLDGSGMLCVFSMSTVDLVVDVSGWFGATIGTRLSPIVSTRVVDSRDGTGGWSGKIAAGQTRSFDPSLAGTVAVGATAVLDIVATEANGPGFLTFYPCGGTRPPTSSVNFQAGGEYTNLATIAVGTNGLICVFAHETTHVVVDVLSSFGSSGALSSLGVSGGELRPAFEPDGHDYGVICAAGTNVWNVIAKGVPGASIAVAGANGEGNVSVSADDVVDITVTKANNSAEHYYVRCLPPDFPPLTVTRPDDPTPGWYLFSPSTNSTASYAVITDDHGAVVWYRKNPAAGSTLLLDFKRLPNGHLAWKSFLTGDFAFGTNPAGAYDEAALDGSVLKTWKTVGSPTDHHEMMPLANGNMLLATYHIRDIAPASPERAALDALGYAAYSKVADNWIQEIKPDGTVAWEWMSENHTVIADTVAGLRGVPITFAVPGAGTVVDLGHLNSIDVEPTSGDLIVSFRHFDAVMRIRRNPGGLDDGKVLWKLGGSTPNPVVSPGTVHLALVNDSMSGPHAQHDARVLANGHVTMYDNESGLAGVATARAVEYTIDVNAETATVVWSYLRPDGEISPAQGSARRQADGSTVIGWGVLTPLFTEIGPWGQTTLEVSGSTLYRAVKEPAANFDRATLRSSAGS